MDAFFYKFLLSHGVTNIIDIDGLLYAAVGDLRSFAHTCMVLGIAIYLLSYGFFECLINVIRWIYHRWKHRQN